MTRSQYRKQWEAGIPFNKGGDPEAITCYDCGAKRGEPCSCLKRVLMAGEPPDIEGWEARRDEIRREKEWWDTVIDCVCWGLFNCEDAAELLCCCPQTVYKQVPQDWHGRESYKIRIRGLLNDPDPQFENIVREYDS